MYSIIKFIENIEKFFRIKLKIAYWKLKYGRRIKIGKKFRFRKGFIINISKNGYLEIGDNNAFNNNCSINCHKYIKIGNNNMFGENVKLYDHNHIFNDKSIDMQYAYSNNSIFIGDNNWIGSDVLLLSKAKIGNYNVISAKVIVNKRFSDENIIKQKDSYYVEKINYK